MLLLGLILHWLKRMNIVIERYKLLVRVLDCGDKYEGPGFHGRDLFQTHPRF